MKDLINQIQITVTDRVYLKDPNSSELGEKIISTSIILMDEIGLDSFTFRKLASKLQTTESSIYRYFENKYKLLIYLTSWYWGWLEYQLVLSTTNISSAKDRLKAAIHVIAADIFHTETFGSINLVILNRIIISESIKAYIKKEGNKVNQLEFYAGYSRLIARISAITHEINPSFPYPQILSSTIIEGVLHQKYFSNHLPSFTEIKSDRAQLADFYTKMALLTITWKSCL